VPASASASALEGGRPDAARDRAGQLAALEQRRIRSLLDDGGGLAGLLSSAATTEFDRPRRRHGRARRRRSDIDEVGRFASGSGAMNFAAIGPCREIALVSAAGSVSDAASTCATGGGRNRWRRDGLRRWDERRGRDGLGVGLTTRQIALRAGEVGGGRGDLVPPLPE